MKKDFKYTVALYYVIICYTLLLYNLYNGLLLCQMQPLFLFMRDDVFSWLFMQTGLPQWLLLHPAYFIAFDTAYYTVPALFLYIIIYKNAYVQPVAFLMLVVNWIYIQCYTLYPTNSITLYIAPLIFPAIFLAKDSRLFHLLFGGLRYFFLYFFFSAGIWKIVNGGVFNPLQLSAILLDQHKEMLTNSPGWWMSKLIGWLIAHPMPAYILYLLVTIMELLFGTGFFTARFDKQLAFIYIFFLLADHLVMRIPYYETLPFLLTFYLKPVNISVSPA